MNEIRIVAGDTARINFSVKLASGRQYTFASGDTVKFTVRTSVKGDAVIEEIATVDTPTAMVAFSLPPEDTKNLKLGKYIYDAKLINGNGTFTIVPHSDFIVEASIG